MHWRRGESSGGVQHITHPRSPLPTSTDLSAAQTSRRISVCSGIAVCLSVCLSVRPSCPAAPTSPGP